MNEKWYEADLRAKAPRYLRIQSFHFTFPILYAVYRVGLSSDVSFCSPDESI